MTGFKGQTSWTLDEHGFDEQRDLTLPSWGKKYRLFDPICLFYGPCSPFLHLVVNSTDDLLIRPLPALPLTEPDCILTGSKLCFQIHVCQFLKKRYTVGKNMKKRKWGGNLEQKD